ncbi:hypothetical protein [Methylocystis sp. B8]|nr:hypothetical protein [Methylocystis sp. B8]
MAQEFVSCAIASFVDHIITGPPALTSSTSAQILVEVYDMARAFGRI